MFCSLILFTARTTRNNAITLPTTTTLLLLIIKKNDSWQVNLLQSVSFLCVRFFTTFLKIKLPHAFNSHSHLYLWKNSNANAAARVSFFIWLNWNDNEKSAFLLALPRNSIGIPWNIFYFFGISTFSFKLKTDHENLGMIIIIWDYTKRTLELRVSRQVSRFTVNEKIFTFFPYWIPQSMTIWWRCVPNWTMHTGHKTQDKSYNTSKQVTSQNPQREQNGKI